MVRYKKIISVIFISLICSSFLFILLYHFDNKYTYVSPQPVNGIIKLEKNDVDNCVFLIYDWEFYGDKFYTPDDFKNGKPDSFMEYISIGERTSITEDSAFGKGTYRLNLFLPDENVKYAVLFPEIYSSYNLYINDNLELKMGDIDKKNKEIQSRLVTFNASGQTQILLNVYSESHYYSGMVYPPVFGNPKNINIMRGFNIFILMIIFMFSFICFVISIYMNLTLKLLKMSVFIFISFAVSLYIGLNLTRYFFAFSSELIYIISITVWYLIYTFVISAHNKILSISGFYNTFSIFISAAVCFSILTFSLFSNYISIYGREIISDILEYYKWCFAVYLIITSLFFEKYNLKENAILLFGNIFFAVSLIFDRIYPVFEPIYGLWFTEISVFVLIVCVGLIQWNNITDAVIFKLTFSEEQRQMKRQIDIHKNHYYELSKNIENTRKSQHDMKHHLRVIRNFLEEKNYDELSEYMDSFEKTIYIETPILYCKNVIIDALFKYYSQICAKNDIRFNVKFETEAETYFPDTDITIIFGNLLENAFEACLSQNVENKFINVKGSCIKGILFLSISNSFGGTVKRINNNFMSSKRQGEGIGIKSVNSIVDKYNGVIDFEINDVFEVFINIIGNTS